VRVWVDPNVCARHGECVAAAPDVFWFGEDGDLEWLEHPPPELEGDAAYGATVCPTMAIRVDDD
jgi:ferredoxin